MVSSLQIHSTTDKSVSSSSSSSQPDRVLVLSLLSPLGIILTTPASVGGRDLSGLPRAAEDMPVVMLPPSAAVLGPGPTVSELRLSTSDGQEEEGESVFTFCTARVGTGGPRSQVCFLTMFRPKRFSGSTINM